MGETSLRLFRLHFLGHLCQSLAQRLPTVPPLWNQHHQRRRCGFLRGGGILPGRLGSIRSVPAQKSLTYLGKQRYDALAEQLELDNTNFRYRILDINGKVLGGNAKQDLSSTVERTYDALYPAYSDSTYITVEEQDLPPESVEGDWSVADSTAWTDVAIASAAASANTDLHYTYITYNQDYIDLPSKCITTQTTTPLKNRVLEWGITDPMTIDDDLLQWEQDASQNQGRMLPTIGVPLSPEHSGCSACATCWPPLAISWAPKASP